MKKANITSEKELIERCIRGDSFKELFNLFKDRVFSTSIRMLGNVQDAEDTTQEIFIKIFKNIKNFKGDSSLKTWIYKISVNTCIDKLKKRKKHIKNEYLGLGNEINLTSYTEKPFGQNKVIIDNEISKLPEKYKSVFILHEIEGFKHEEISEIMNIPPGTSKSHLFVAKSLLRKKLLPYLEVLKNEM
ncbi:RNA polymerase sigma factor [candidate division KSB1 bacterium]